MIERQIIGPVSRWSVFFLFFIYMSLC